MRRLVFYVLASTVALCGAGPELALNGIRNGASGMPLTVPGSRLAPGARVVLTGIRLAAAGKATRVLFGSQAATVVSAAAERVEAIVPLGIAVGPAGLRVVVGEERSAEYKVTMAAAAPGIYTDAGLVARPGGSVVVSVTGLGKAGLAPRAFVGGVSVATAVVRQKAAGISEVRVPVPAGVPSGCHVPLQLDTGAVPTNTVTVAVAPCEPRETARVGPKYGFAIRTETVDNGVTDVWAGFFQLTAAGQAGPLLELPPAGQCVASTFAADVDTPIGASLPSLLLRGQPRVLNAGPHLNLVAGPQALRIGAGDGPIYQRKLPPPLPGGELRLASQGGSDVGSFSVAAGAPVRLGAVRLPEPDSRQARGKSLVLAWEPGAGDVRQTVLAALAVRDAQNQVYGFVVCRAEAGARRVEMAPRLLGALPAAGTAASLLWLAAFPAELTPLRAAGLEYGYYVPAALYATSVFVD